MKKPHIAVIGAGIAGLSAAWLLSRRCAVTLFDRNGHAGGHSNTQLAALPEGMVPVDTGFIVYNERNYPNLTALFHHLGVASTASNMSFSFSHDGGRYEYNSDGLGGLFGQRSNVVNLGHWRMLKDIQRFFAGAEAAAARHPGDIPLGEFFTREGYSRAFLDDHIVPMAAAIWSSPAAAIEAFPARSFIDFYANHGLLQVRGRPVWRTVTGGSREYVRRLVADGDFRLALDEPVQAVKREADHVLVMTNGRTQRFDEVVFACHADAALALLADPTPAERQVLGRFRYSDNHTILHTDRAHMPRRRRLWASWNYLRAGDAGGNNGSVTYWMNRLQALGTETDVFVTLNPARPVRREAVLFETTYRHPILDDGAVQAQAGLWPLQGQNRSWFCGSYFGFGFHEDALQSGLAVAETLGGLRRPWQVEDESGRIHTRPPIYMEAAE
jgi:predicted NAD/FAD-binding protein